MYMCLLPTKPVMLTSLLLRVCTGQVQVTQFQITCMEIFSHTFFPVPIATDIMAHAHNYAVLLYSTRS